MMTGKPQPLSHLALSVGSLDTSGAFYQEVLGFTASTSPYQGTGRRLSRLMEVPDCELRGLFLRNGSFFLELLEYQPGGRSRPAPYRDDEVGYAHLSFIVTDLDATAKAVDAHGGEMRWDTRVDLSFGDGQPVAIAFCLDPDGNRIELVHHRDAAGRRRHAGFLGAGELGWPTAEQRAEISDAAAPLWS